MTMEIVKTTRKLIVGVSQVTKAMKDVLTTISIKPPIVSIPDMAPMVIIIKTERLCLQRSDWLAYQ